MERRREREQNCEIIPARPDENIYTRAELLDAPQKRRALHWRNSPFINTDFREIQLRGSSAHNERPVNTQLFFDGRALSRSEWSELDINLIAASRIQTPQREGL